MFVSISLSQEHNIDSTDQRINLSQNDKSADQQLQVIIDLLNNQVIPALTPQAENNSLECESAIDSLQTELVNIKNERDELENQIAEEKNLASELDNKLKQLQAECYNTIESLKSQGSKISSELIISLESNVNTLREMGYPVKNASIFDEYKVLSATVLKSNNFISAELKSLNSIATQINALNQAFGDNSEFEELESEKEYLTDILSVYQDLTCELKSKIEEVRVLEYNGITSLLELQARLENYNLMVKFPFLLDCIESFGNNPVKNPLASVKGVCE